MSFFKALRLLKLSANVYDSSVYWTQRFCCVKGMCQIETKRVLSQYFKVGSRSQIAKYFKYQAQQISSCNAFIFAESHQSIRPFSFDAYPLDKLRADVERSFTVNDSNEVLVHDVGISESGKTLVFPFLNPKRRLQSNDEANISEGEREPVQDGVIGTKKKLPSISTILQKTKPIEDFLILKQWEERMIKTMGEEAFQEYREGMLSQGKTHHKNIEALLSGVPESEITVNADIAGYWKSVRHVLADTSNVECMEQKLVHPYLGYCGYVDCVSTYKGHRCVIEWKTSRKRKATLKKCYDYPLQAVAYAGAVNYDAHFKHEVTQALIVIAYEDGRRAHVHSMSTNDCEQYWSEWLSRVLKYRELLKKEDN